MNLYFRNPLFLILSISCLIVSCRREKSDPPEIEIIEPASGLNYQIYDTIHIKAVVHDDLEITKLTCSLINYSNAPVLPVKSFQVNTSDYTVDVYIVIDNTEIPTGNYNLMIFASDGETDVRAYQSLVVHEINRQLKSVFITASDYNNGIKVFKRDSTAQPVLVSIIPGDFSGAAVSARHNQYYIAGQFTGNVTAIHTQSLAVSWSIANNATGGAPYFTGINKDKEIVYVSRYDGKILGYNHLGNQEFFAATDQNSYPTLTLPVGNRLLAIETGIFNGNKNILVCSKPSGTLLFRTPVTMDVKSIVEKNNDEVYIIGNENGGSKVYILNLNNGLTDLRLTLSTYFVTEAVAINEYVLILASTTGLYEFNNNSSSITPLIAGSAIQLVRYDDAGNEIYATSGKTLSIYGYQVHTLILLDSFLLTDSIRSVDFLFNREKFN